MAGIVAILISIIVKFVMYGSFLWIGLIVVPIYFLSHSCSTENGINIRSQISCFTECLSVYPKDSLFTLDFCGQLNGIQPSFYYAAKAP